MTPLRRKEKFAMRIFIMTVSLTLLLLVAAPGMVLAAGENIRFESLAELEIEQVNAQGEKILVRTPATLVVPGSIIIYTNRFDNQGKEPAEKLKITNPIPKNMEFLAGSALPEDATIVYSIDGGKMFDAAEALFVIEADGTKRPAEARDYTHIRWTLKQTLSPGETGFVEFRARLK